MEILFVRRSKLYICTALMCSIYILQSISLELSAMSLHQEDSTQKAQTLISQEQFSLFLGVDTQLTEEQLIASLDDIEKFTQKLAKRKQRYRSEKQFLKYTFYKIHNRYLKHYTAHASLNDLLDKGQYDCITGSAFYALILEALEVDYIIKELPYHVYLIAQPGDEKAPVLLESTDARSGFVEEPERVQEMIRMYAEDVQSDQQDHYTYNFVIDEEIGLKQLAALNYYNEAVDHYNQQNLKLATQYLDYASYLYPAKRMETLRLLINQVTNRPMQQAGR
ncbi:hypothetical protein OKW21_003397 [Catalinimonas alkaloidigena]|nr:hypothetical protein [Catalinimonas alkaloidigena]